MENDDTTTEKEPTQLDRIEAKLDSILSIMVAVSETVEDAKAVFDGLEDSPMGNTLFSMLGLKR